MDGAAIVDTYVSTHNAVLLESFVFAENLPNPRQAVENGIENCYAVLVGMQYLGDSTPSDPPLIDVFLDKAYSVTNDASIQGQLSILKAYWEHFLSTPRRSVSAPSLSPWRLISILSAHLLHLSSHIQLHFTESNAQEVFQCIVEARKLAQRLAMQSEAHSHSKWLEGLSYIWQALAGGDSVDQKLREQVLNHAKKLLITAEGTKLNRMRQVGRSRPSCLEEPCSAVIGALSELLGFPLEAIWWYRKYRAEDIPFSLTELPTALSALLSDSSAVWSSVNRESRAFCLETVSTRSHEYIVKLQVESLSKPPPMVPIASHPAFMAPSVPKPSAVTLMNSSLDNEYAVPVSDLIGHVPSPVSPLRRSVMLPAAGSPLPHGLHSVSTVQFLERSRRNLELSVAMPTTVPIPIGSGPSVRIDGPRVDGSVVVNEALESGEHKSTEIAVVSPSEVVSVPVNGEKKDGEDALPKETMAERLERRIALFGLVQPKQVPGDGNCQFYSLSDQLYGDFAHATQIRGQCVSWLRHNAELELENGAKLKEFGYNDEGWDHYCTLMQLSGTWGDHLTLVAVAELFHVRIVIVSSVIDESQAIIEIVPSSPAKDPQHLDVIYLCHYAEFHYGSLQPE